MKKNPVDEYLKKRKLTKHSKHKLLAVILSLSVAVVFTVSFGLRLTGITLTADEQTADVQTEGNTSDTETTEVTAEPTAESTAETAADTEATAEAAAEASADTEATAEATAEASEETAATEEAAATADTTEAETAADAGSFTLTSEETDGFTVTVTGDNSVLPYPAEEMQVSVKAQNVSDLNDEQKDLYKTLLASQADQADQILEAVTTEDGTTTTEEVDDKTLEEAKSDTEGQSVVNSDGTEVAAGTDTKASTVTNYLFDVTLVHNGEEVEPTGEVQVSIQSDVLKNADSTLSVIHLDEAKKQTVDTEAVVNTEAGTAELTMDSFSKLVIADASGNIQSTNENASWDTFVNEVNNGSGKFTYTLEDDIETNESLYIRENDDVTIDLNGHHIIYGGVDNNYSLADSFINVMNNTSTLTIQDTSKNGFSLTDGTVVTEDADHDDMDNLRNNVKVEKSSDNSKYTVNYYDYDVSETGNADNPLTTKITQKTATFSSYICNMSNKNTSNVVWVQNGGTANINGGLLTRTTTGTDTSIIRGNTGSANVNISDNAYLAGSTSTGKGAAVQLTVSGSKLDISGGVIVANKSNTNGGAIYTENTEVNISNGKILNNTLNCNDSDGNGYNGGGGIACYSGTLNISGGSISGNISNDAGGGIYVGHWDVNATLNVTGGTIAANKASTGEGGGIRVSGGSTNYTTATISSEGDNKVYITDNETGTTIDWGGGGVFVQEGGRLYVYNSLITQNTANCYGGGVAACPSGGTILQMANTGLYGNTASGNRDNLVNHTNNGRKPDDYNDHTFDKPNQEYCKDFYAVSNNDHSQGKAIATITSGMLGGGEPLWTGAYLAMDAASGASATYYTTPGEIDNKTPINVKYVAGLTSNANSDSKSNALADAKVIIDGNYSSIHGGGIMANGIVVLGAKKDSKIYPTYSLNGIKKLMNDTSEYSLSGRTFKFLLLSKQPYVQDNAWYYDESGTNAVGVNDNNGYIAEATMNSSGNIAFSNLSIEKLISSDSGTFTLYMIEEIGSDSDVNYDKSVYYLTFTYDSDKTDYSVNNNTITTTTYKITGIAISKDSKTLTESTDYTKLIDTSGNATVNLYTDTNTATFTNKLNPVDLQIYKYSDVSTTTGLEGAVFKLYSDSDLKNQVVTIGEGDEHTLTTDAKGYVEIGSLYYGTYYLSEVTAPAGYNKLSGTIEIVISPTDSSGNINPTVQYKLPGSTTYTSAESIEYNSKTLPTVKIANSSGTELPNTGGIGTDWFVIGGCGLMSIAVIYAILLYCRKERGDLG